MTDAMDFNGADTQDAAFALIPAGTLVRIRLTRMPLSPSFPQAPSSGSA